MTIGALVTLIAVLIFAAHFFEWVFSHTKIPDALLLIIVGFLLGPVGGFLSPDYFGEAADLAVMLVLVIVLFEGGLHLRLQTIQQGWRGTLKLTVVNFAVTMGLVGVVLWGLFGMEGLVALMVGSIVGGTSSVVVIPLLSHLTMQDKSKTMLTLEAVFSDVLVIVVTIALLAARQAGKVSLVDITTFILISFFGAVVLGVGVAFVWARLLSLMRPMQNSIFTTPAAVLLLFGLVEQIGLSGPIAALAFGVVMGNMGQFNNYLEKKHPFVRYFLWSTSLSHRERVFFSEAVFLLQTFFFVFVGLSLRINRWELGVIGLALVGLMLIVRPIVVRMTVPKDVPAQDAAVMGAMVPKGLAAAALAAWPLQQGVAEGEMIQGVVYAVILFSVLLSSLLVFGVYQTSLRQSYIKFFRRR